MAVAVQDPFCHLLRSVLVVVRVQGQVQAGRALEGPDQALEGPDQALEGPDQALEGPGQLQA